MDWETKSVFACLVHQTSHSLCVKNKAQLLPHVHQRLSVLLHTILSMQFALCT